MSVKEFLEVIKNLEGTIYKIQITNKFKKSLNLSYQRKLDLEILKNIIYTLAKGEKLEAKYRPHILEGYKAAIWECHVKPDWLLLW
jgi:mRNA interferase YafQ